MRNNTHAKSVAATLCQAGIHWNFNLSKKGIQMTVSIILIKHPY